ncbi:uncharacterized protein LOC132281228 [Cornus florida]|uniref:uncharacterized protein LOC132281228 n=1 Tax=Cornus florida TaxID=4283 RepID=UPI00289BF7E3|nr:uncharacterized protein LOC132281228 [Cornus florida]
MAMDLGFLRGFRVGRDVLSQLEISHLMFADDTLVNVGKSVLVPVGVVLEIVVERIDKLQRNFLWGGKGEEFKYHLVNWEQGGSIEILEMCAGMFPNHFRAEDQHWENELVLGRAVEGIQDLANILGFGVGSFLISYLGLPLGAMSRRTSIWDPVVERFERRLAGWKQQYLSKEGKITLMKSTPSNLPNYFMSFFSTRKSVV